MAPVQKCHHVQSDLDQVHNWGINNIQPPVRTVATKKINVLLPSLRVLISSCLPAAEHIRW